MKSSQRDTVKILNEEKKLLDLMQEVSVMFVLDAGVQ